MRTSCGLHRIGSARAFQPSEIRRKVTRCYGVVRTTMWVGTRVADGLAEAEDQPRTQPARVQRQRGIQPVEVDPVDLVARKEIGQGLAPLQGVDGLGEDLGRRGAAVAGSAGVAGSRCQGHGPLRPKKAAAPKTRAATARPDAPPHQSICRRMNVGISISGTSVGVPAAGVW